MRWHCGAAHRWKGAAGGNFFRVDIRRQMKCDVPTPRETLHPQNLQAKDFRRQWGQTHGLQATMHIWQSCEQQPAQLQNLARLLSATSMMQHKCGPLWHVWTTVARGALWHCDHCGTVAMYLPADQGMSVAPSGRLPSVRRRPDGSFMLGTSALCSERQMISFMA